MDSAGNICILGKSFTRITNIRYKACILKKNHKWINDERIWDALQSFLLEHKGHVLIFDNDDNDIAIEDYVEVELDHLSAIPAHGL